MRIWLPMIALIWPAVSYADTFVGCTKAEAETIARAVSDAKRISVSAAAAVGDTPEFETWFGKYSPAAAETVRGNLKRVVTAIRTGRIRTKCEDISRNECEPDIYAYVYDDEPYLIRICPPFFSLPNMARLRPGQTSSNFGTRAGTIVHEITHFNNVADTDDNCYARDVCADFAQDYPSEALRNADSYQYFVEDITYFKPTEEVVKPQFNASVGEGVD
ncbi:Lysine-specific metallo-endopeptidase [Cognatiyoonia koreensis]|uniref:Lysine-specific metallo-endopeptidase n=1 Tax=Cognatiyoonia koreensis TaxID=364200 RepID=A0A1I0PDF5_9RHOB|nr:M35 family metallo-endopeptidase [Cognatiyoonia koreensis]SEW11628.1 Lysine-specific metallo-endopeptidase [Cognatiyoonia koreensis]